MTTKIITTREIDEDNKLNDGLPRKIINEGYCPICGRLAEIEYVEGKITDGVLFNEPRLMVWCITCVHCGFDLHICTQFEELYDNLPELEQQCIFKSW